MKYAIRYFNGSNSIGLADEIIIKYEKRDADLVRFATEHKDVKVVANATNYSGLLSEDLDILRCAKEVCPQFTVLLSSFDENQRNFTEKLKENGINFFFSYDGSGTIDKLESQVELGASEVYITNELGFNIKALSEYLHGAGVQVRVFPNVAQSSASSQEVLNTFKFFFIRPEDTIMYQNYIDTYEFYCDVERQDLFYDIYFNKGYWDDDLSFLIKGLDIPVLGNTIPRDKYYAKKRLSCRKECYKCSACDSILQIANAMREKGYSFDAKGDLNGLVDNVRNSV